MGAHFGGAGFLSLHQLALTRNELQSASLASLGFRKSVRLGEARPVRVEGDVGLPAMTAEGKDRQQHQEDMRETAKARVQPLQSRHGYLREPFRRPGI
jgi:hypothetical protein